MTLRAKFRCDSVADFRPNTYPGSESWSEISLSAMYSNTAEDNQFSKATPSGSFKMTVTTDEGRAFFNPGKYYFLDISEVES